MHFDNPFVIVFIASSSLSFLVDYVLNIIQFNYRKKNGRKITEDIKNYITPDEIDYLCTYNNTDCFYYFIKTPINTVVWIFFYLCGLYPFIYNIIWKLTNNIYIPLFIFELFLSFQSLIVYIPFFFLRKKILKHKMNIDTQSFSGWFISQIKANIKGFFITILPVFFMYIFFLSHFPTQFFIINLFITSPKLYQGFGFTESNTVPTYLLPIGFFLLLRIVLK